MTESTADGSRGTLFIISAPSGAGKTSLLRDVLETSGSGLALSISHTTLTTVLLKITSTGAECWA